MIHWKLMRLKRNKESDRELSLHLVPTEGNTGIKKWSVMEEIQRSRNTEREKGKKGYKDISLGTEICFLPALNLSIISLCFACV